MKVVLTLDEVKAAIGNKVSQGWPAPGICRRSSVKFIKISGDEDTSLARVEVEIE